MTFEAYASWIAASHAPLDTIAHDPADGDTAGTDGRPPYLRREFVLRAAPVRARIYIATLGGYRLTVNGAPAGPGVFTPDWTDYRYRVTYQTYDATGLLHAGPNAIGVLLGAGWYASRFGFSSKRYAYGPPPVRMPRAGTRPLPSPAMANLDIDYGRPNGVRGPNHHLRISIQRRRLIGIARPGQGGRVWLRQIGRIRIRDG